MAFRFTIVPEQNLVINTIEGHLLIDDYYTLMEAILNDSRFKPSMNMFWDFREGSLNSMSSDDLEKIKLYIQSRLERRGSDYQVVFLVSEAVDHGLSRMYQIISDSLPVIFEAFKNYDEALAWINADNDSH